jgi:hypothetical protein
MAVIGFIFWLMHKALSGGLFFIDVISLAKALSRRG